MPMVCSYMYVIVCSFCVVPMYVYISTLDHYQITNQDCLQLNEFPVTTISYVVKWRKVYGNNKKNFVERGEIAHYEQLLHFSQCFHKSLWLCFR